ncbi:hypothetical protein V6V47_00590 [Micromonospora sp. CPCC 205539]|uniref:hypothetical protein n=1 Tax=Micromonospora sp. CPCC 205539 TaxID=3122408 RepID=UPI002FEF650A
MKVEHSEDKASRLTGEQARLPVVLMGRFRPWTYRISHAELEIRRTDGGDAVDRVMFYGVLAVKLKSTYSPLILRRADERRRQEMLDFLGIEDPRGRIIPVLVSSGPDDGFVACASFVLRQHL